MIPGVSVYLTDEDDEQDGEPPWEVRAKRAPAGDES